MYPGSNHAVVAVGIVGRRLTNRSSPSSSSPSIMKTRRRMMMSTLQQKNVTVCPNNNKNNIRCMMNITTNNNNININNTSIPTIQCQQQQRNFGTVGVTGSDNNNNNKDDNNNNNNSHNSSRPRREAPLPPLTNPIELAIEAARQRGELNNLSGAGKPIVNKNKKAAAAAAAVAGVGRMSPTELLSKKAEYEMRRGIRNNELDDLDGMGEKLKYKGTVDGNSSSTSSSSTSGGGGGGGNPETMTKYILKESKLSAKDMKNMKK